MGILVTGSSYIMPVLVMGIVLYGIIKRTDVYDDFVDGAKNGISTVVKVMPTLIGLMIGVGVLRESGFMNAIGNTIGELTKRVGFSGELVPITIVKIFSSSAATGMLLDIYKSYGVDSYISNVASIMLSSTETVFYTMSVYFMTAKVTKTRWTFSGAMVATLAGTIVSVIMARMM